MSSVPKKADKLNLSLSLPWQNGRQITDDILKCVFMNEKLYILIQISLKFFGKGQIDNESALVQVMAWHWTGDKPLTEPMLTWFTDAHMWHQGEMS